MALEKLTTSLRDLAQDRHTQSSTFIICPLIEQPSNSLGTEYGRFEVPHTHTRRQQPEVPISQSSSSITPSKVVPQSNYSNNAMPRTTIPICYAKSKLCDLATNSCSGHGTCVKKYTDQPDAADQAGVECWACACSPTVSKDSKGRSRKTYWGGPACQKEDVSVSFFILLAITVLLVGVTSWGVGLMYSVGEETLPSVIGAGVAGPRAQK